MNSGETHIIIIFPHALYGCGTWPLALREEHRLKVFQNRALGNIFGSKEEEVRADWRAFVQE
jgi:hypothetical protein